MESVMLYKDLTTDAVTDVDTVKGVITGYFSIFGNKDSDGDIVMPGAYKKTLRENGPDSERPRILHLYMHDPSKVLGKPKTLKEDKKGLYFETEISKTSLGKDVLQLYMDKVLTEHSIGYQIVKREVDERAEIQKLMELKLWEGSTVSWGANMDALVDTVKSGEANKETIDNLLKKMEALENAIKGNYTDETARLLEIQFKQIQQAIISLVRNIKEPVESTQISEKPKETEITTDWILQTIKRTI